MLEGKTYVRCTHDDEDVETDDRRAMSGGSDGWGPPGQNVSGDFLPEPPRDPKLAMVLKNGTRVEFIVPSTDGEIVSGRVVRDEGA